MAKTMKKKATSKAGSGKAFEQGVGKLAALAAQMEAQIEAMGLASLTDDERMHSMGRLRTDEAAAMTCLFDAMDAFPNVFEPIAAKDGGADDAIVETAPPRAALARAVDLMPVAKSLGTLLQRLNDDVMASAQAAKEVSVPAYGIAKAGAATSPKLRSAVTTALNFYGSVGRSRALKNAKVANVQKRAAKKPTAAAAG